MSAAVKAYLKAREPVIAAGYEAEIDWARRLSFEAVSETMFLQEAAWVMYNSGMSERVIRAKWEGIRCAFFNFADAYTINSCAPDVRSEALGVFNSARKVDAVLEIVFTVKLRGWEAVKRQIAEWGIEYLMSFPMLGPATAYHLARNLGLDVAKPDRHLLRIARAHGYGADVQRLCREVSEATGDRIGVVDLVFWRHAALTARKDEQPTLWEKS